MTTGEFSYGLNLNLRLGCMMLITALGIGLGITAAVRGDFWYGIVFSIIWGMFFTFITIITMLASSNIRITEDFIAAVLFGRVWMSIGWSDVKTVKIMSVAEFPTEKKIKYYYLQKKITSRSFLGKWSFVYFSDSIQNVDTLKHFVSAKIDEYSIRVVSDDSTGGVTGQI